MFEGKKLLISGGTGLIGRALIDLLKEYNPASITSVSMDSSKIDEVNCVQDDLRYFDSCLRLCGDKDYIFHLAGIKGSVKMCQEKPYSFSVPSIQFNANMVEAFRQSKAKAMLVTSSVGVYGPAEIFNEDDVWDTFPSKADWFAGHGKRCLELNVEAYNIEYGDRPISIVRPANVYGKYDSFTPESAMVVPSLIRRICAGENPLVCWSDGSQIRDIIHAKDVARGMIHCLTRGITQPVNIGTGDGISIKELVNTVVLAYETLTDNKVNIEWDTSKHGGDKKRVMNINRLINSGFELSVPLFDGILDTMSWYLDNKSLTNQRYEAFKD